MAKIIRIAALMILDVVLINFSYILSYLLRFEFDVNGANFNMWFNVYGNNILAITVITIVVFWLFGIYTSMWRYAGSEESVKVVGASIVATMAVMAFMYFTTQSVPRSIYIYSCTFIIILVVGSRIGYRLLRRLRNPAATVMFPKRADRSGMARVMVVGCGDAGASIINEIKQHPESGKKVVIAVDNDHNKIGKRILGVRVAGNRDRIGELVSRYAIDEIIIAIPSASRKTIQEIVNVCNKTRCRVKILPALVDLIEEKVSISKLRDVDIEDLLGRDPVKVNLREISGYLEGRIVMVTGGGGSIGSELCRQIARFRPRRLVCVDIYENTSFELANEIHASFPDLEYETVIASVRDKERMREVFAQYKPHVVFHAAAHKHVPLMEHDPQEALKNNIIGTKNLIDLADEFAVLKFVMISTDKAVNPTSVMGASKRVAEMILQEKSKHSRTSYSAVRFGNVLGSNGSVIPIFRKQIAAGGPVTVTHPDITRFFMTIPEAVQLVIQTGAMGEGGEVFVLDMGEPVKIMDLAMNVIKLSGFIPNEDIDIEITGLRPGEKLYEELLLDEEGIEKTAHDKIYVGHPLPAKKELVDFINSADGVSLEQEIARVCELPNDDIKEWLRTIVVNYTPETKSA